MKYEEYDLYKKNPGDKIMWVDNFDVTGEHVFTLDGKTFYNLFADYHTLPADVKEIFDKENPFWKEFFEH